MGDRGWSTNPNPFGTIFIVNIITALISLAVWALVICAIFGWRNQPKKENSFPPAPPTFGNEPRGQNATPGFPQ